MVEPISSPFQDAFDAFSQSVSTSCLLCSPYVTQPPVRALVQSLQERGLQDTAHIHLLTDISLPNLVQGSTDIEALLYLRENVTNTRISYLPRIHAKVYIADERVAVVGSANWTTGGAVRNYEYGLRVDDPALVKRIHADISGYALLGGEATTQALRILRDQVAPLREVARESRAALNRTLMAALHEQQQEAENNLIRIRVEGRSVNAVFSDTILYLLKRGPMTTTQLNDHIRQIHPDLCDDAVDRVIDGVHYGKKWKHGVRGAQVTLARGHLIGYSKADRLWRLTRA
jgi:hypothetical protein